MAHPDYETGAANTPGVCQFGHSPHRVRRPRLLHALRLVAQSPGVQRGYLGARRTPKAAVQLHLHRWRGRFAARARLSLRIVRKLLTKNITEEEHLLDEVVVIGHRPDPPYTPNPMDDFCLYYPELCDIGGSGGSGGGDPSGGSDGPPPKAAAMVRTTGLAAGVRVPTFRPTKERPTYSKMSTMLN